MSITTYAELQSTIADFLNRQDLTATIPAFISLAEADMRRSLRHWRMEARATTNIDTQYSELPDGWLEMIRMRADNVQLDAVSHSDLLDMTAARNGQSGAPRYYAITNGTLEVFPVPDKIYSGEMVYFRAIDPLTDAAPSNWVLTEAPDAYLYGALVHSAPYLQEDGRAAVWGSMYQSAIDSLNRNSKKAKYSGTGLRMRIRGLS